MTSVFSQVFAHDQVMIVKNREFCKSIYGRTSF
jgi:hypothetical protein